MDRHRARVHLSRLVLAAVFVFGAQAALPAASRARDAASRSPRLIGEDEALPLAGLAVEVAIVGRLAQTTITMTFRNPHERPLEAELDFPLPEGATVAGYALDIEGEMVEGTVVEQRVARVAFEQETHKRVDPGLVEFVRGSSFKTRVWPVPALGTRTVRVRYVEELAAGHEAEQETARYVLPLHSAEPLDELSVQIEASGLSAPAVRSTVFPDLRFSSTGSRHAAAAQRTSVTADEALVVVMSNRPRRAAVVEIDEEGDSFFMIDDRPDLPAPASARRLRRIGILWDASLSRARADLTRERALLARWLASLGDVEVELTVFRNVPEKTRRLRVEAGNAGPILGALDGIAYDGGTSLAALPMRERVDALILFSDGLATLGAPLPPRPHAPLYAVGSSIQADHAVLRRIAEESGGLYLNLARTSDDDALRALGSTPFALLAVEAEPGAVADVQPAGPRPIQGTISVTGRLLSPQAVVTLRYGRGQEVLASQTFTLRRSDATRTGLVPRFWAQQKAAELSLDASRKADLLTLARRFNLVTPGTSLLVLETLEQHLAHQITPPRSRGTMRADYLRLVAEHKHQQEERRHDKIERVTAMWEEYVAWWQRDFRRLLEPRRKQTVAEPQESRLPQQQRERQAPREPQAPPPPEPRAAVSAQPCRSGGGEIQGLVTDESGAALPGARVEARHTPRGGAVYTTSGADGAYRMCGLQGGQYALTAELTGFATFGLSRLSVPAGRPVRVPVTLRVGSMAETITVTAETPAVDSQRMYSAVTITSSTADTHEDLGGPTITVKEWDPNTPYLAALKQAPREDAYAVYLTQREAFGSSPAFFLDCADFFYRSAATDLAVRILTSVLELKLDEPRVLRVVARRLQEAGEYDLAVDLFERIVDLRPEEPHSPRDLALALVARADALRASRGYNARRAAHDYARALDLFNQVVLGEWDARFEGIEEVALVEANRVLTVAEREGLPIGRVALDPRFRRQLDVDLRIVLAWDTDATDMDLWVSEPSGEKCFYQHNLTAIGGRLSRDMTDGYGPEQYTVRRADGGNYRIEADYYGSRSVSLLGPTSVQATIITDYGRPGEKSESMTVRLSEDEKVVEIGTARFGIAVARR